MSTIYGGTLMETEYKSLDRDVNLYCPNDACVGFEREPCETCDGTGFDGPRHPDIPDGPCPDCGGSGAELIRRVAWDSQPVGPSGPTYACGGEPGYDRVPECPECGESGEEID